MTCQFTTPTGALNAILLCAQNALANPSCLGIPGQIVVGGAGADAAFSCCDEGLLAITYETMERTTESLDRTRSSGSGSCVEEMQFDVHVKVLRCAATFRKGAGGATDGGPISPAQRTADSLANAEEAWYLLQALNCCVSNEWKKCHVTVIRQDTIPVRGQCIGHDTTLRVVLKLCCPPIPRTP